MTLFRHYIHLLTITFVLYFYICTLVKLWKCAALITFMDHSNFFQSIIKVRWRTE